MPSWPKTPIMAKNPIRAAIDLNGRLLTTWRHASSPPPALPLVCCYPQTYTRADHLFPWAVE